eukprot:TRINITY_DN2017_c0_g1_i1.p1 TRINITY_DN2017_c0_g1~~TRINITY_DN2017_c0_g1_i1.p1  ORF type:complete len:287 (-),score=55.45 TRINITY_DN2017_c0_g1_i1:110-970(-)
MSVDLISPTTRTDFMFSRESQLNGDAKPTLKFGDGADSSPKLVKRSSKAGVSPLTSAIKGNLSMSRVVEDRPSFTITSQLISYTQFSKYSVFWSAPQEEGQIYEINIELPRELLVREAIRESLKAMNEKLDEKKCAWRLDENEDKFEFFYAKKNGKAKLDYPSLYADQNLHEIGLNLICLREKSADALRKEEVKKEEVVKKEETVNGMKVTQMPSPQFRPLEQNSPVLKKSSGEPKLDEVVRLDSVEQPKAGCCSCWRFLFSSPQVDKKYSFRNDKTEPLLNNSPK